MPPCLLSRVRARERRQETRGTRRKTGSIRHETQGTRQDICPRQKCHHCHVASRPFLAVGVSQPCRKVLLRGSPPESREMGPELGPRLQGPLKEGPVCGPRIRAALLGKSRPTIEEKVLYKWRKSALPDHFWKPAKGGPKCCPEGTFDHSMRFLLDTCRALCGRRKSDSQPSGRKPPRDEV